MPKPLVFMMGCSPAIVPIDRHYAQNHMWISQVEAGLRLGFSDYAVRLLGDLTHLQWSVKSGDPIKANSTIGFIEGSKATSDLFVPQNGTFLGPNDDVLANPSLINTNLYDSGWLFEMTDTQLDPSDKLLSPEEYVAHLEACWPMTLQLLKGQAGK